jgi:polyisoprenoid-binding protein YceI
MRMPKRSSSVRAVGLALVLPLVLPACGGVQRALVSPIVEMNVASAPSPSSSPSSGSLRAKTDGDAASPVAPARGRRWVFHSALSRFAVESGDLFGTYGSLLTSYRGTLTLPHDPKSPGHVSMIIDMTSLQAGSRVVTAVLQYEFLEVDAFPQARLEATLRRSGGSPDDCVVEGTLDLHGQRRRIVFKGSLKQDNEGYHFTSTFDLDRHAFGIRRHDRWDFLANSDFRVTLDLRGTPERVTVDELE